MRLLRFAKKSDNVYKHFKRFSEHKHASSLCSLMENISRPVLVMILTKRGEIIGSDVAAEMRVCERVCEWVCEPVCERASERSLFPSTAPLAVEVGHCEQTDQPISKIPSYITDIKTHYLQRKSIADAVKMKRPRLVFRVSLRRSIAANDIIFPSLTVPQVDSHV